MASVHKREGATGVAWQVKYRTPEGGARSKTFKLKRDADRFARTVETSKDVGGFVDPRRAEVTVGAWADQWLAGKTNLAASTRARYTDVIEARIKPRWGDTRLAAVRHEDVQAWLAGIDRAPATVRKVHRVFSQLLDYAVKAGRMTRNPALGVSLPRVQAAEKRYLTHAQVDALAVEVGPVWALLVYFLAYTGLRWGEAAALRVSRLDLLRRRAIVVESVTPVGGVMAFGPTKTHERREVPLPRFLVKMLEVHLEGLGPDSLVFTGPRGAVLRGSTFRSGALNHAAEALGLCVPKLDAAGKQAVDGRGLPVFTGSRRPRGRASKYEPPAMDTRWCTATESSSRRSR